jgi:LPXTG-motif cell wall-anchored protein
MLRKLAAGTSAAVVAAGLAAAPAMAARLPGQADESCGDVAQTGPITPAGFVFGPFADVPQLASADRTCLPAAAPPASPAPPADGSVPPLPDLSSAHRHDSAPPPTGVPVPGGSDSGNPGLPGVPPPDTPDTPGSPEAPGGPEEPSAPPSAAVPPPITPQGPAPDTTPLAPQPTAPAGPTPTMSSPPSPGEFVGPAETATNPPRSAAGAPGLPQTGGDTRPLAAAGGFNLLAAGIAVIAGARRRNRKRRGEGPEAG